MATWPEGFCGLIRLMFLAALLQADFSTILGAVFVAVTLTLMAGLSVFLRQVFLATAAVRG